MTRSAHRQSIPLRINPLIGLQVRNSWFLNLILNWVKYFFKNIKLEWILRNGNWKLQCVMRSWDEQSDTVEDALWETLRHQLKCFTDLNLQGPSFNSFVNATKFQYSQQLATSNAQPFIVFSPRIVGNFQRGVCKFWRLSAGLRGQFALTKVGRR